MKCNFEEMFKEGAKMFDIYPEDEMTDEEFDSIYGFACGDKIDPSKREVPDLELQEICDAFQFGYMKGVARGKQICKEILK